MKDFKEAKEQVELFFKYLDIVNNARCAEEFNVLIGQISALKLGKEDHKTMTNILASHVAPLLPKYLASRKIGE